jgi:hypothetical protein
VLGDMPAVCGWPRYIAASLLVIDTSTGNQADLFSSGSWFRLTMRSATGQEDA